MIVDGLMGSQLNFPKVITALVAGCNSLLDLGCCDGSTLRQVSIGERLYVDIKRRENTPEPFLQADIRDAEKLFKPKSYDVVTALDVIEHLQKVDGWKLIADAERIARKRAIFFTPFGPLWTREDNDPDSHHSGWVPSEFESLGYQTCLWTEFHKWETGHKHGAFVAWKTLVGTEIKPESMRSVLTSKISGS